MIAPDSSHWLVTINGRTVTQGDLDVLNQRDLAAFIIAQGEESSVMVWRSEFDDFGAAEHFRSEAARTFPEDDVRLWASVDPSTKETA